MNDVESSNRQRLMALSLPQHLIEAVDLQNSRLVNAIVHYVSERNDYDLRVNARFTAKKNELDRNLAESEAEHKRLETLVSWRDQQIESLKAEVDRCKNDSLAEVRLKELQAVRKELEMLKSKQQMTQNSFSFYQSMVAGQASVMAESVRSYNEKHKWMAELETLKAKVSNLEVECQRLDYKVKVRDMFVADKDRRIVEVSKELEEAVEVRQQALTDFNRLSDDFKSASLKINDLEVQLTAKQRVISDILSEKASLRGQLNCLLAEVEQYSKRDFETMSKLENLENDFQQALAAKKTQIDRLAVRLDEAQSRNKSLDREVCSMQVQLIESRRENVDLRIAHAINEIKSGVCDKAFVKSECDELVDRLLSYNHSFSRRMKLLNDIRCNIGLSELTCSCPICVNLADYGGQINTMSS